MQEHLISLPSTDLQWGILLLLLGFASLLAGLIINWLLRQGESANIPDP